MYTCISIYKSYIIYKRVLMEDAYRVFGSCCCSCDSGAHSWSWFFHQRHAGNYNYRYEQRQQQQQPETWQTPRVVFVCPNMTMRPARFF